MATITMEKRPLIVFSNMDKCVTENDLKILKHRAEQELDYVMQKAKLIKGSSYVHQMVADKNEIRTHVYAYGTDEMFESLPYYPNWEE